MRCTPTRLCIVQHHAVGGEQHAAPEDHPIQCVLAAQGQQSSNTEFSANPHHRHPILCCAPHPPKLLRPHRSPALPPYSYVAPPSPQIFSSLVHCASSVLGATTAVARTGRARTQLAVCLQPCMLATFIHTNPKPLAPAGKHLYHMLTNGALDQAALDQARQEGGALQCLAQALQCAEVEKKTGSSAAGACYTGDPLRCLCLVHEQPAV